MKKKLSKISLLHYWKLAFRSCLFILATIIYITNRIYDKNLFNINITELSLILIVIWIVFAVEIMLRCFPSKFESMGCQKQFKKNYLPTSKKLDVSIKNQTRKTTVIVAILWIALNLIIGILYYLNIIDYGILILICLAFSVCDMICILFFCPFQTWIMKNKCCGSCRIYNWDYAMMFTPLIFIRSIYTWSLLGISLILLIKWEIEYHCYPEQFYEVSNANLECANCKEKLCNHKQQLRDFLKKHYRIIKR